MSLNGTTKQSNISRAFIESVPATATMTAFSYALSKLANKQFKEPELLNYLVYQQPLPTQRKAERTKRNTIGLLLHYMAGVGFATAYEYLWRPKVKLPTAVSGAAFGVLAGLTGSAVWEMTIQLREKPPGLDRKTYYPHLILAHVIFGTTAALASDWISKRK